jgi:deoxyribonuclease V
MILAFDTYYFEDKAKTVGIGFNTWAATTDLKIYTEILDGVEDYIPGEFYRRELPCILSLLKLIDIADIEFIIVDGFVYLDDEGKPGLGAHLFQQLEQKIPVIGLAKSNFATLQKNKRMLIRGDSKKPLFVTSVGIDIDLATSYIREMSGLYRMPAVLKYLDTLTKEIPGPLNADAQI